MVDIVYKYKADNVIGSKLLLNIISGAIGEVNKKMIIVDEDAIDE